MSQRRFVLDAYAARSCPLKTVNAFNPRVDVPAAPPAVPPPSFHDAEGIETEVVGALLAHTPDAVDLRGLAEASSNEQETATLGALESRVPLVVGGLLPRDWANHRSGRPSLLLLAPDRSGYMPVQIKFYRVLQSRPPEEVSLVYSTLAAPRRFREKRGRSFRWNQRVKAALQVAHYWRLLEASGHAASRPLGGLVGLERVIAPGGDAVEPRPILTWLDLAEPVVAPRPGAAARPETAARVSTLERYDSEHAYRAELAARALEATGPRALLTPIVNRECSSCRWRPYCVGQLDADDLSLRISKAPLDVHEVQTLRDLGISTVSHLAGADLDGLERVYLPRVGHRDGGGNRLRLAHHRARLIAAGVELERQTAGPIRLARHELEIDLDIETSADDRVYLWGFFVDDEASGERYYRHFSSFTGLGRAQERSLALDAMAWLRALVDGRDAAVYHYSDYEVVRLNRLLGSARGRPDRVELAGWARAFASTAFVDLFGVVKRHFFGANGLGLKVVVTAMTSFRWRDEDPSGLNSQAWFDEAVRAPDPALRERSRRRVLDYNEDDVLATRRLRAWLRTLD